MSRPIQAHDSADGDIKALLGQILRRLDTLALDVASLKEDVASLKEDVMHLQQDMASVKSYIRHAATAQEIKWTLRLMDLFKCDRITCMPRQIPLKRVFQTDGREITDLDGAFLVGAPPALSAGANRGRNARAPRQLEENARVMLDPELVVVESKNHVDKVHVDRKLLQMMAFRRHVLIEAARAPRNLNSGAYSAAWRAMVADHGYLRHLERARLRLFFASPCVHPDTRRYIEAIRAGAMDDGGRYEALCFEMAESTDEFRRVTRGMKPAALARLDFGSLRQLLLRRRDEGAAAVPRAASAREDVQRAAAYLLAFLREYTADGLGEAFAAFRGAIGYVDDLSVGGLPADSQV